MRIRIKIDFILLLLVMAVPGTASIALGQVSAATDVSPRPELALTYNYLRSNAPAGDCGCFALNGGGASFAWPLLTKKLALVGDVGVSHASGISKDKLDLTLSTFAGGLRYRPRSDRHLLQPYGQVLAGLAHSSGSLVDRNGSSTSSSGAAFAGEAGGGLDFRIHQRIYIRLIEADYLVTTFDNGVNDHQNILRVQTGLVFHF